MKRRLVIAASLVGVAVFSSVVLVPERAGAHHAFSAEFDPDAPLLLRGRITKIEWVNPHTWIHVEAIYEGGDPIAWMVEGGTPNTLLRRGLTRETLKPGTEVIVRGYQSKNRDCDPACLANGRDVTFLDGRKLFMGSSGTGAPRDGSDPIEGGTAARESPPSAALDLPTTSTRPYPP
jgi:hypothetical protein